MCYVIVKLNSVTLVQCATVVMYQFSPFSSNCNHTKSRGDLCDLHPHTLGESYCEFNYRVSGAIPTTI